MNILCIGDVVSRIGCDYLADHLPALKRAHNADIVIANGENSSQTNGISPNSAERLLMAGVDIITTGNHAFRRKEICEYFEEHNNVLRPANYPSGTYGNGFYTHDMGRTSVTVINMMGVVFMENLRNPFECIDEILKKSLSKIIVLDFHGEATSEKLAMANYLDGRISAMFGTHTHVQTADAKIFPKGTGYITDVGMTGPIHSVLGVKPELAIQKLKSLLPVRFETAEGECMINAVLFEIDEHSGKTTRVQTIRFADNR